MYLEGLDWSTFLFLVFAVITQLVVATTTLPAPLVIAPSQYWEGNDGQWSTFTVQIGTPAQNVRVLVSTSGSATWVVLPEGCPADGVANCGDLRGKLFNRNASSTWKFNNYYELQAQVNLGYSGSGEFGFDKVGVGWQGSGGPVLDGQVVTGIALEEFWLGSFGLTPRPTNFTDFNDPQQSFLETLKNKSLVPSLSWSYTAGAVYRFDKVPGSVVFGGYDAAKTGATNISFSFGPDISRDLTVGLQSISTTLRGQSTEFLSKGIYTFIDSTLPYIWLPLDSCEKFEKAFGLSWNPQVELYIVNNTLHESLLSLNASLTFKIGTSTAGGSTIDVVLPYASFDLSVDYPLVSNKTKYFPLKRAANDTQYTLGRTFLQESYLTADYERSKFYLSQTRFDHGASQSIIAIPSLNSTSNSTSDSTAPPTSQAKGHTLSTGAIAGIAIGSFLVGAAALIAAFFLIKKRRSTKLAELAGSSPGDKNGGDFIKAELDAGPALPAQEIDSTDAQKYELLAASQAVESAGPEPVFEMAGDDIEVQELPTPVGTGTPVSPLQAPSP